MRNIRIDPEASPGRVGLADSRYAEDLFFLECLEEGICDICSYLRIGRIVIEFDEDDFSDCWEVFFGLT